MLGLWYVPLLLISASRLTVDKGRVAGDCIPPWSDSDDTVVWSIGTSDGSKGGHDAGPHPFPQ